MVYTNNVFDDKLSGNHTEISGECTECCWDFVECKLMGKRHDVVCVSSVRSRGEIYRFLSAWNVIVSCF